MSAEAKWADLLPRIVSAVILIIICGVEIYIGGLPFSILVWFACGLMTWELARMFGARSPLALGVMGAIVLMLVEQLPVMLGSHALSLPLIVAAALVGALQIARDKWIYIVFAMWILVGSYAFLVIRHVAGLEWLLWLVAVVIVSDIAGYFAGRMLGGPKFWPRVSPKKTWSGTVAGWGGAALVGLATVVIMGGTIALWLAALLSAVTAFAGQMGDIAESAVKRRVGIKDSSALIPGHGGVLDRFDAMLGAGAFALLLWYFDFLPGTP
jgi:phosphatidate cytidylyltransferase